ncbi:MAG TPA: Rrf2 family transcriptional regulator [Alphaproteobacteria bacterium]|jgi:Rrf2 family nitric oxide-sensitive transcriptional repressor|nr:Rrf2 family transcriptional regulator [Alphaproteobacteria bacterium]
MRLTRLTDYSFRVLIFLAANEGRHATIREIAARYNISRNHLMKVANLLARHGFVRAMRGRGGGLALARAPEEIGLGDVVRRLEDDFAVVACMGDGGACRIESACALKPLLSKAVGAFLDVLDGATLADLVRQPKVLVSLLDRPGFQARRREAGPKVAS